MLFHIGLHTAEVLRVFRSIHGKRIIGCILNGLCLVLLTDDDHHVVHLILRSGYFTERIVYLIYIEIDYRQEQEQHQAQEEPDDLDPAFFSGHDNHREHKQQEQRCTSDDKELQRQKSGSPHLVHQQRRHQKLQQTEEESQPS